ncbi:oxygen-dependent choline dehydrogenase-like [Brevipalpus obovatus]|uniref:oxygen-dependent choline dehydrogenase-like n=1 Tax=Brevipalpus obovatus TaxID=246614 RepID=UPI003D9EC7AC
MFPWCLLVLNCLFLFIPITQCIDNTSIPHVDDQLTGIIFSNLKSGGKDVASYGGFIQEVSRISNWVPRVYNTVLGIVNAVSPPGYPLTVQERANPRYDYIIVGAGSAGSVLAARLSEDPKNQVLILEAGEKENGFSLTPFVTDLLQKTGKTYAYRNIREKKYGWAFEDNRIRTPVGRGIGGGSGHNSFAYIRGNPVDYNRWEQLGASGWSWPHVFPYFLKLERVTKKGISTFDRGYYGTDGPLAIQGNISPSEIGLTLMRSAESLGYIRGDVNGRNQTRFSFTRDTIERGQRCSTGRAYLSPASKRKNLHILTDALVHRILIDSENMRADGVEYKKNGILYQVRANREVIVSAGVYNTPKILMLSGIGPKAELKRLGIPLALDLSGVGENLQDHPTILMFYTTKPNTSSSYIQTDQLIENAKLYAKNLTGSFSLSGTEIRAFVRSKYALDERPDINLAFAVGIPGSGYPLSIQRYIYNYKPEFTEKCLLPQVYKSGFNIVVSNVRHNGRGKLTLANRNPEEEPIIDHRYLDNDHDLKVVLEAAKIVAKISESRISRQSIEAKPFPNAAPGCEKYQQGSDDYFECYARTLTVSGYHPVGTCKMGSKNDPTAVVDPELRVRGMKNLRVIDSSIMPEVITGNTNAPTIMIAEKAADIIRGRKLQPILPPVNNPKSALKYQ